MTGGAGARLRVLDVTKFYSESGGGVKTYLAAKQAWAATRDDVSHSVVLPGPRDDVETTNGTRVYRIRGPRIPVSPSYRFLLSVRKLRHVLERERPHVVEVGSPFLVPWITLRAARSLDVRFAGFYHCDLVGAYARRLTPDRFRWIERAAVRLTGDYVRTVYRRFDTTIAATQTTAALLRELDVPRVVHVPLAVDLALFHPRRRDASWRRELDIPEGAPILLYAGRLCREKEVDVVMRAVPALHDRYGAIVVFVGDGHLRPEIERMAAARPRQLRLLPYETDRARLARAYASSDVFLAPFSYETFGLGALEAMACGTPVAGADNLGLADLLAVPWGRTFRPGDPGDLVRAVGDLLAGDLQELGRAARAAAAEYTWERTFERQNEVYRELAAESGSAPRRERASAGAPGR